MEVSTLTKREIKLVTRIYKVAAFASSVSGIMRLGIRATRFSRLLKQSSTPLHPAAFGRDPLPRGERVRSLRQYHAFHRICSCLELLLPARRLASGRTDGPGRPYRAGGLRTLRSQFCRRRCARPPRQARAKFIPAL